MRKLMAVAVAALALLLAVPAQAQGPATVCNLTATLTTSTSGATQMVAAPAATQSVRVCGVWFSVKQGSSAVTFGLVTGTGTNCGTGTANLTPAWPGVASTDQWQGQDFGNWGALYAGLGNAVCLDLSAAPTSASVQITYAVY